MVGKIKRVRQKLHQGAVKLDSPGSGVARSTLLDLETAPIPAVPSGSFFDVNKTNLASSHAKNAKTTQASSSFPCGIFAGTKINPEALVQTLKFEEPSNETLVNKGPEDKKQQSKKEKMKERRDRWLNKISSIKLAREQQVAQAKRQAMPVVGDMRPLADALPELSQLLPATKTSTRRKNRVPVKKKPEPTDFSLMKASQKRKLIETETSRFSEAVKDLASKTNPLAAISEHLRKRMRQEEEQGPS
ncbi:protein FAM207A [Osmerus eperlanus]|uniref:protein FAM207A n=1 Tax=Osmerus eperlanus TaxID=29151 RepID=UPI002E0F8906